MKIEFVECNDRVKISEYPMGTVFSFDALIYMKIGLADTFNDYGFVHLSTGMRPTQDVHASIDYGSVEILDAKLIVTRNRGG